MRRKFTLDEADPLFARPCWNVVDWDRLYDEDPDEWRWWMSLAETEPGEEGS